MLKINSAVRKEWNQIKNLKIINTLWSTALAAEHWAKIGPEVFSSFSSSSSRTSAAAAAIAAHCKYLKLNLEHSKKLYFGQYIADYGHHILS